MSERLCVFCQHMAFDDGGYGEYADPAEMFCKKGRWAGERRHGNGVTLHSSDDLSEFRKVIVIAKDCPDYTPPKS